jgi:hypothetical protein
MRCHEHKKKGPLEEEEHRCANEHLVQDEDGARHWYEARCPYCGRMNTTGSGQHCEHYDSFVGGCGAYEFIFRRTV